MSHLVEWSDEAFEEMATAHVRPLVDKAVADLAKESGMTFGATGLTAWGGGDALTREYGLPDQAAQPFILGVLDRL